MQTAIEFVRQPWPWYISGMAIAAIMLTLIFFGKHFGFSSNFKALCAACGAGKASSFFDYDWKAQKWNLWFLVGSMIGGWLTANFLSNGEPVQIAESTIKDLATLGLGVPTGIQPAEIFNFSFLFSAQGILLLAGGGFLVGFGTRYADGCTSGHAISGLSNLQLPSLISVIGFFIGGLVMTHLLYPLIFKI
ncbi:MAG: YeeE/YedE thiosulfate transporter family protein [Chitinophagales bacterium]|nr:YeeE/YedE thiosulfate transporter family protein [Chitinophagales bacterium]